MVSLKYFCCFVILKKSNIYAPTHSLGAVSLDHEDFRVLENHRLAFTSTILFRSLDRNKTIF
jgi:hypothetical protein